MAKKPDFDFSGQRRLEKELRDAERRTRQEQAKLPRDITNHDHDLYHGAEENFQSAVQDQRRAERRVERNKPKEGGCYITTACIERQGMHDDCYELSVLRRFRDEFVAATEDGQTEIAYYYNTAPEVVSVLNTRPNRQMVFASIFEKMVLPTIRLIEAGNLQGARHHYKTCMLELASYCLAH